MSNGSDKHLPVPALSKASTVEVSLVVLLCSAIAAGAVWTTSISIELTALRELVESGVEDRWKGRDMRAWVDLANREVEIWSERAERQMGLEPGVWERFEFPDPDIVRR